MIDRSRPLKPLAAILLILCAALSAALSACTPVGAPAVPTPTVLPSPTASPDIFVASAWVNKPTPGRDERVTLYGHLNKNGVYLSGIMMYAYWPEEGRDPRTPNCAIQMNYARGTCAIEARDYPAGVYVPIRVEILYQGVEYTAETGFTP